MSAAATYHAHLCNKSCVGMIYVWEECSEGPRAFEYAEFMSQRNNGKPEGSRRGRPTTGRDPVVAVRLPHEAIAGVDNLARALGLSSRSDAIRYMIIRATASIKTLDVEGGLSLGPTELRSKKRERFQIEVFAREPGKWRASIRHSDGSKVRVGDMRCDLFTTSVDTSTADQALQLARKAIDAGAVQ